jgi:beta-phosphoglucomutase
MAILDDREYRLVESIIFDAEGVVIDTESVWDRAQSTLLASRGYEYDRTTIKPLLTGKSLQEGSEVLKVKFDLPDSVASLSKERRDLFREEVIKGVKYIDGFLTFFAAVSPKYRVAIATAMEPRFFPLIRKTLNLDRLFGGAIVTLDHVQRSKPAPDLFLYAANFLGTAPEHCVVIEDAPYGIEAAHRAGMFCIALGSTYPLQDLRAADLVVRGFENLTSGSIQRLGPMGSTRQTQPFGRPVHTTP